MAKESQSRASPLVSSSTAEIRFFDKQPETREIRGPRQFWAQTVIPIGRRWIQQGVGREESCCKTQVLYVYVFAYVCACTRVGWVTVGSGVSLKTPKPSE